MDFFNFGHALKSVEGNSTLKYRPHPNTAEKQNGPLNPQDLCGVHAPTTR